MSNPATALQEQPHVVSLEIEWDKCHPDEWQRILKAIPKSNIIQTAPYAWAMRQVRYQGTRFGVIKVNGVSAGLVQIQEVHLLRMIHHVFLDRGPLWLPAFNTPENMEAFFIAFDRMFPRRLGRKRRLIPEMPLSDENQAMMERLGYKQTGDTYHSIWIDLSADLKDLRAKLTSKWRRWLKKAEAQKLSVVEDKKGMYVPWLMKVYMEDRRRKIYAGAAPKLMRPLFVNFAKENNTLFLRALKNGQPVSAILIFIHGTSATYQLGWTNDIGRDTNAHNLLLWKAMVQMKAQGVTWFDLGGINEDSAKGVTKFKEGIGGDKYKLVGVYR